jgi:hypothetical protein
VTPGFSVWMVAGADQSPTQTNLISRNSSKIGNVVVEFFLVLGVVVVAEQARGVVGEDLGGKPEFGVVRHRHRLVVVGDT